ncbi:acyl-CoA thioesterase [Pseudogemmobacter humi]|uniref:Bifunctional 3-hydroxyacyl-CoA dehydrogenase/thioesterase n=1 Tax=Pseudogemmobacter humi TaxID=2483812 RepID=A0A3P5XHK8_9RHOB|nr:thioesterase family protein [Pseudogemmobacter humi]VDC28031.1 bifunctional 3-hydroxyacyl-CoA dehydrogenase/thioesterase [Pseudogemmobacter humi]
MQEITLGLPSGGPDPRPQHWRGNYRICRVAPGWIDLYGHMNMACYAMVFDLLGHEIFGDCGIGADWTRQTRLGLFTVHAGIDFRRELREGDPLRVTLSLTHHDDKRLFAQMEMHHARQGYLAATMAQTSLCASLETRRAAVFPPETRERLAALM